MKSVKMMRFMGCFFSNAISGHNATTHIKTQTLSIQITENCESFIAQIKVTPIFGKGETQTEERKKESDEEDDEAVTSRRDEIWNRTDEEHDGGDSDGEYQLKREDGVDFPDESPTKLGVLSHLRIQLVTSVDHSTTLNVRFRHGCC